MDSALYKISTWVMRIAYVNIFWITLTFSGLLVFGFFPATTATFAIVRQWIRGNSEAPIFLTMWSTFKKEFLRSNIIGAIIVVSGIVLYIDFLFFRNLEGLLGNVMMLLFVTMLLLYGMVVAFIFPVLVHYEVRTLQYLAYAFIYGASYPLHTFYIILSTALIVYGSIYFPPVVLFFTGSLAGLLAMRFAYTAIQKAEEKKVILDNQ